MTLPAPAWPLDRAAALQSRLAAWRGWQIRARCAEGPCPANRAVPVEEMLEARGNLTLRETAAGLRCSACGAATGQVALLRCSRAGQVILPLQGRAAP
ncbi:hypothetical protein [Pseudoroseomonas cervicalis]|uniref:hypothetical protein n=1 Tax=Teichococcus cervicalis TaxID=204525 RepID=UPI0022F18144|nr:hypothetical protein [Pseudoroseomonas cervicalis]WBV41361.1 hypothetical protein PFY06_08820 [Pseudoroseomonas cervicalis]